MCLKSQYFLLQAVKVHVTTACPSTISNIWGFISSQRLYFAPSTKPISFFIFLMPTTIALLVILVYTIYSAH